ncbi:ABC transporter ATP-binding protein [Ligilactobacillus murinus]|jgi:ABC-2 type transport system ATP-binding protein|uniref:ABC transporter ATP-binding protein n=2 Tax=Bacilli TaxID=91061 RepID=A0A4Q2AE35_9LACO|nr:ABC transporter ATP-binding protein [Ligilactobacillus murinus]NBH86552.1 ABC transporter ATP-binding protein [Lachnospiraceae bacterium]GFI64313.1 ABC transporter ATP-binding protein YtrB [Lactobacillaceae bacterium]MBF0701909.1 ABC transporter ATP-binding protein [Ligilactobacillus murinus]MCR1880960.1 ABC transporter ATP-binding protein [Ligilactobacillus murinus]MCZ0674614.1 ABC transporter ATP-binding protein [Ligilactobacillus murinus]
MKTVIKVKNVQKTYDKRVILKQVDLEIKKGEIVALLGRNGAGKSTLLNVLLQLVSKDQGEIEILGEKRLKTEAIGVMLQNELTLERTTVKEILELWRSYYPKSKSYAELLTIADLEEKQETFIAKLSGGQRRSLQFALCLAGDPEVIFLDEPTVGMDLKHRQKFWEQIKKLQTAGKTFLITSHYLEELQNVVQRFLILKDGSIAFAGTLQELQQNGQKVTFRFTSVLDKRLFTELPGVLTVKNYAMNYIIQTTEPDELIQELVPYLPAIKNLSIEHDSLNELFLEVTGGTYNVVSK